MEFSEKAIKDILSSLYQFLGASFVIAVLFMFAVNYAKISSVKQIVREWIDCFKNDKRFRKIFVFAFFTAMLLFRTVMCRSITENPLKNVIGVWGIHDKDGNISPDGILNAVLFIPFTYLLFDAFGRKIFKRRKVTALEYTGGAIAISFCFSLSIELCQLFFKLGEFQLSDLFYNTLGGFIGGLMYFIVHGRRKRR